MGVFPHFPLLTLLFLYDMPFYIIGGIKLKKFKNTKKIISVLLVCLTTVLLIFGGFIGRMYGFGGSFEPETAGSSDMNSPAEEPPSDSSGFQSTNTVELGAPAEQTPDSSNEIEYGSGHSSSTNIDNALSLNKDDVYSGFPNETNFNTPQIGGNTVLSTASDYGITASAVLMCIGNFPNDNDGMWEADGAYVVVRDSEGRTAYNIIPNALVRAGTDNPHICTGHKTGFDAQCVCRNSTRLFQFEEDGKKHTVLMQYIGVEKGKIYPTFFDCDLENWFRGHDINDNETADFIPVYEIKRESNAHVQYIAVSDEFDYVEGATFTDTLYNYNITFDYKNHSALIVDN